MSGSNFFLSFSTVCLWSLCILSIVFFQVDQQVFEELVREKFPKLGLSPLNSIILTPFFVFYHILML